MKQTLAAPKLDVSPPSTHETFQLSDLKSQFHDILKSVSELEAPSKPGLSTGLKTLDEQLPWKGLPSEGLSAFVGAPGTGRTRLWSNTLALLQKSNPQSWGVWLDTVAPQLYPPALAQMGVDLRRLLLVRCKPEKKVWALSQIIRSRLFHLVGCQMDLSPSAADIQKLATECRTSATSVVLFFDPKTSIATINNSLPHWLLKLRLSFEHPEFIMIEKAQSALPHPTLVRRNHEHAEHSIIQSSRFFDGTALARNCG